jgi:glycosyltransferase involved in cell wall biosynthesis
MARDAGLDEAALTLLQVPYNDVPMYLGAADIALLVRKRSIVNATASPVKLAEYMAAGLPVVMSDGIGDLSEAVSQNRLGCVLNDRDSAERLSVFIGEVQREAGTFRERIISWCEQNLSWSVHLPALVNLYESLCESPEGRTAEGRPAIG